MSEKSNIEWCDSTINFWEGCTKVSAGCAHCYAEARDKRFTGGKHWGKGAPRRKVLSAVKEALAMNRKPWVCDFCGHGNPAHTNGAKPPYCLECKETRFHRRRIFSLSLGDWLDEEVPIEMFAEALDTIRQCDQVIWILCSKRLELFVERMTAVLHHKEGTAGWFALATWVKRWLGGEPPPNIILLASVENQEQADIRIPQLLEVPAACHGLSVEPMLGPIDLSKYIGPKMGISWIIIGGESGQHARPCNVDWIRSGVAQCQAAGVAVFVKQLGADPRYDYDAYATFTGPIEGREKVRIINGPLRLKDKKGGDPSEWPVGLDVRQWPTLAI